MDSNLREIDRIQRLIADLIAKGPAGVDLLLIGGFRYRLLNNSQRFSVDIDYHCGSNLYEKQKQLETYCQRVVLREVKREFGYHGSAQHRKGPEADSENAALIDLGFWKEGRAMEVPIEITRIVCFDAPIIRTVSGTIYPTPSDADVIEGKIVAIMNRVFLQHRDLLDVFLYSNHLRADSGERMKQKVAALGINPQTVARRLKDLQEHSQYHASAIQKVIDTQVDPIVASQINSGGGGATVLADSLRLLKSVCSL